MGCCFNFGLVDVVSCLANNFLVCLRLTFFDTNLWGFVGCTSCGLLFGIGVGYDGFVGL